MGKTIVKKISSNGFEMEIVLRLPNGNDVPYFVIVGNKWRLTKSGKRDKRFTNPIIGGAIGEEFVKKHSSFADINAFHLRDMSGKPMHCFANGIYFLGFHSNGEKNAKSRDVEACMSHFRLTQQEVADWIDELDALEPCDRVVNVQNRIEKLSVAWNTETRRLIKKYFNLEYDDIAKDFPSFLEVK